MNIASGTAPRPRVAVLTTVFHYRSHDHCFLENLLQPYLFNGAWLEPSVDVASMYVEQFPPSDMARDVARDYGIPIFQTIDEALCMGGDRLAVDAVLSIAEHGDYPRNAQGTIAVVTHTPTRDPDTGEWLKLDYFGLPPAGAFQLYNLRDDRAESSDRSEEHPDKVQEVKALLDLQGLSH